MSDPISCVHKVSPTQLKANRRLIRRYVKNENYLIQRCDTSGNTVAIVMGHKNGTSTLIRTKRQMRNRSGRIGYKKEWYTVKGFEDVSFKECFDKYCDIYAKRDK